MWSTLLLKKNKRKGVGSARRWGDKLCNFKSRYGEGLIEKVLFEERAEIGSANKCKDLEEEAYLSFFGKYINASSIGEMEWGLRWVEEDKIKEKSRARSCGTL